MTLAHGCEITPIGPALELRESSTSLRELDPASMKRIDQIWAREMESRPGTLFNGNVFAYLSRTGDTILGRFVEYKYYVAQKRDPFLRWRFGIRPLAVSGLIITDEGILFGRRSRDVTGYPDFYELIPSGSISGEFRLPSGDIDYRREILRELEEEVGVSADLVTSVWPLALVYDPTDNVYDVVVEIKLDTLPQPLRPGGDSNEYQQVELIASPALRSFVSANVDKMVPTSLAVLTARFDASQNN